MKLFPAVGFIVLLIALATMRRRRMQRTNLGFIARPTAPVPQSSFQAPTSYPQPSPYGQTYGQQYGQYANYDPTNAGQYPQPPQQAYHTGQPKPAGYDIEVSCLPNSSWQRLIMEPSFCRALYVCCASQERTPQLTSVFSSQPPPAYPSYAPPAGPPPGK